MVTFKLEIGGRSNPENLVCCIIGTSGQRKGHPALYDNRAIKVNSVGEHKILICCHLLMRPCARGRKSGIRVHPCKKKERKGKNKSKVSATHCSSSVKWFIATHQAKPARPDGEGQPE